MTSFQEKLTTEEIKALESLSADSLRVEDLLGDLQPSTNDQLIEAGQPLACGATGGPNAALNGARVVVEGPGAPYQNGLQGKSQGIYQLPILAHSTMDGVSLFPKEKLMLEELIALEQLNCDSSRIQDPLPNLVPSTHETATANHSDESGEQPNTSGSEPDFLIRSTNGKKGGKANKNANKKQRISEIDSGAVSNKKEAQRLYRARNRQKTQEAKAQLETSVKQAQEELEALKLEQDHLHAENRVLQAMIEYKDALVARARSAMGSFTSMASNVSSYIGEIHIAGWNNFVKASDEQIEAVSRSDAVMLSLNRVFFKLLASTLMEWGRTPTENRPNVERKLGFILNVRRRGVSLCWRKDPLRVATKMHRPPVDLESLAQVANAKACISNDELMAACALTEDQKVALMKYWNEYLNKYNASRSVIKESATALEKSIAITETGAHPSESFGGLSGAAQGYLSAANTVAALEEFSSEELIARSELILGAWDVLRPLQQLVLMLDDVTPQPDVVALYKSLLRLDQHDHHRKQQQYTKQPAATLCHS